MANKEIEDYINDYTGSTDEKSIELPNLTKEVFENMVNEAIYEGLDERQKKQVKFEMTDEAKEIASAVLKNDNETLKTILTNEADDNTKKMMCNYYQLCKEVVYCLNHYYIGFDRARDCQILAFENNPNLITIEDIERFDMLKEFDKKLATAILAICNIFALHNMNNKRIPLDLVCIALGLDPYSKEASLLVEAAVEKLSCTQIASPVGNTLSKNGVPHETTTYSKCIAAEMYTVKDKTIIKLLTTPLLTNWLYMR